MKKGVGVLLMSFLVLGIFMNSFFILAADNNTGSSDNGSGDSKNVNGSFIVGASCGTVSPDSRDACCVDKGYDKWDDRAGCISVIGNGCADVSPTSRDGCCVNRGYDKWDLNLWRCVSVSRLDNSLIRARVQEQDRGELRVNGTRIQTQREVQTEDGKTTVQIQRTMTYANGTQVRVQVQIETETENGTITRTINVESGGKSYNATVSHDLNVSDEFAGNQSRIFARLSNGQEANVSILPDQALNATLARLRIREREVNNGTNVSIQLKERIHNNIPQVVYNVEANQTGRFLGIFKVALKSNTEVDASTGEVVSVNRPWWAFLVAVPSSQSSASVN